MSIFNTIFHRGKQYEWIRAPKRVGWMTFSDRVVQKIIGNFIELGFPVQPLKIALQEYEEYFDKAEYTKRYPEYYTFALKEKSLEHFIAAKLLELTSRDVYIDIASEGSPVPEIYNRLFGVQSYRQDLAYPAGFNGNTIGGNAADMPIPDNFASKMALHCSLEHFEGNSDSTFFIEAMRVLRPGGRLCVVPFYVFKTFSVVTDPEVARLQNVTFDKDAVVYCIEGWGNRHGRYYDPKHFIDRIAVYLINCKIQIIHILNAQEVDPSCYSRFALLIEKNV